MIRNLFLIPPLNGVGGEPKARSRASATRYGEPGGVLLDVKHTPPDCSLMLAATLPASGEG